MLRSITTRHAAQLRKEVTLGIWLARNHLPLIVLMTGYRAHIVQEAYNRENDRLWFATHKAR